MPTINSFLCADGRELTKKFLAQMQDRKCTQIRSGAVSFSVELGHEESQAINSGVQHWDDVPVRAVITLTNGRRFQGPYVFITDPQLKNGEEYKDRDFQSSIALVTERFYNYTAKMRHHLWSGLCGPGESLTEGPEDLDDLRQHILSRLNTDKLKMRMQMAWVSEDAIADVWQVWQKLEIEGPHAYFQAKDIDSPEDAEQHPHFAEVALKAQQLIQDFIISLVETLAKPTVKEQYLNLLAQVTDEILKCQKLYAAVVEPSLEEDDDKETLKGQEFPLLTEDIFNEPEDAGWTMRLMTYMDNYAMVKATAAYLTNSRLCLASSMSFTLELHRIMADMACHLVERLHSCGIDLDDPNGPFFLQNISVRVQELTEHLKVMKERQEKETH